MLNRKGLCVLGWAVLIPLMALLTGCGDDQEKSDKQVVRRSTSGAQHAHHAQNQKHTRDAPDNPQTLDMPIESRRVAVGESSLHYLVAGPEDGLDVVLLHGAKFNAETWKKTGTIVSLASAGYRVTAMDFPGCGETPPFSIDRNTFLATVLPLICKGKAVVVSPSASGVLSLPLAINSPEMLAGYVIVATPAVRKFRDQLGEIRTPTLVIWGEKDRVFPLEYAEVPAKGIPNATKVVLKDAGHACYLHVPRKFNEALLTFLSSLPDSKSAANVE